MGGGATKIPASGFRGRNTTAGLDSCQNRPPLIFSLFPAQFCSFKSIFTRIKLLGTTSGGARGGGSFIHLFIHFTKFDEKSNAEKTCVDQRRTRVDADAEKSKREELLISNNSSGLIFTKIIIMIINDTSKRFCQSVG